MSRDSCYQALVIKKQAFAEADDLVTFFTQEAGKKRGLAKSLRLPKSKLQHALQPGFLVAVTLVGKSGLPQITQASIVQPFPVMRSNLSCMGLWFVAAELFLKSMPDEHANLPLFELYCQYLEFLNSNSSQLTLRAGEVKFKLQFCAAVGFALRLPAADTGLFSFSHEAGGFVQSPVAGSVAVGTELLRAAQKLFSVGFEQLNSFFSNADEVLLVQLNSLLSEFIAYQLERDIKAEKVLELMREP